MNIFDKAYYEIQFAKMKFAEMLKNEEGVSNIVATVLLLVIVVAAVALLSGSMKKWMQTLMGIVFPENPTTESW